LLTKAGKRLAESGIIPNQFLFKVNDKNYTWSSNSEKISLIRSGLPYAAIESISKRTKIPVTPYLSALEIVQPTYNKKKKNNAILSKQDSEFIFELIELYDFGLMVFNHETEKFQRWLRKPNIALGQNSPDSLFDSLTGIREVKKALQRIEYGSLA
jgi:putative toxin-antitoxin system antitoxin component (TIGR02293 family)